MCRWNIRDGIFIPSTKACGNVTDEGNALVFGHNTTYDGLTVSVRAKISRIAITPPLNISFPFLPVVAPTSVQPTETIDIATPAPCPTQDVITMETTGIATPTPSPTQDVIAMETTGIATPTPSPTQDVITMETTGIATPTPSPIQDVIALENVSLELYIAKDRWKVFMSCVQCERRFYLFVCIILQEIEANLSNLSSVLYQVRVCP